MTEEKILAYLNLGKNQKIDKWIMKCVFWFDVSFTWGIILFGLLLRAIEISVINIIFISFSAIINIVCLIWCKKAVNPVTELSYTCVVLAVTVVKLFYGYIVFSKMEAAVDGYPRFSWLYGVVLAVALLIVLYMWSRMYGIFKDLKTNTIEQARENIKKKKTWFWWIPISVGPPMIYVRLLEDGLENMGLGIGFGLWVLACVFLCLTLMAIPKYIIAKKYKVADVFENEWR